MPKYSFVTLYVVLASQEKEMIEIYYYLFWFSSPRPTNSIHKLKYTDIQHQCISHKNMRNFETFLKLKKKRKQSSTKLMASQGRSYGQNRSTPKSFCPKPLFRILILLYLMKWKLLVNLKYSFHVHEKLTFVNTLNIKTYSFKFYVIFRPFVFWISEF